MPPPLHLPLSAFAVLLALQSSVSADVIEVEGQPLGANLKRLDQTLEYLGAPLEAELKAALHQAARAHDAAALQTLIDPYVLATIEINPELRVKAMRGAANARLQQHGFTPVLLKVHNAATVNRALNIDSPQSGAVYAGASYGILQRQAQVELKERENTDNDPDRFLSVDVFRRSPMTRRLSGLEVEYVIALVSSSESGKREALLKFDIGQGTQDLGFRGELPVLFDVAPAVSVPLRIHDVDGKPTTARLTFRDASGRVYPPQPKRLAPDLFFQPQVYRSDGQSVLLAPGRYTMTSCRGPEYREIESSITVRRDPIEPLRVPLERWIDPAAFGFFSGDHHIHGAGCSHYTSPSQGILPEHVFQQVKGEGLNVGCVLTWGPCYDYQRRFFSPSADKLSDAQTIIKYDLEISGFGSAALGHVCLLNLKDQTYPGSDKRSDRAWPTWTVPVMRWCKEQGGVTGYPHSALGLDPTAASAYLIRRGDRNDDGRLSEDESKRVLLPAPFSPIDTDGNRFLSREELTRATDLAADELPNLALPSMDGKGAMEIVVSVPEGVCDFISAMDTERISEWNTWYHLLNCGFPLKLSGETDFPCMSSRRVGQGRVYVQLDKREPLDFVRWVHGLRDGRSYVSDGFAHALEFTVGVANDPSRMAVSPGPKPLKLSAPARLQVTAKVAFAPRIPKAVAYGTQVPATGAGRRVTGDTVVLHAERNRAFVEGVERTVELIVNGEVHGKKTVRADGTIHDLAFEVEIESSSWIALRHFPQLHTNPVTVIVGGRPIRASRASARWCEAAVEILWENRNRYISEAERPAARAAYDRAIVAYRRIATESER